MLKFASLNPFKYNKIALGSKQFLLESQFIAVYQGHPSIIC